MTAFVTDLISFPYFFPFESQIRDICIVLDQFVQAMWAFIDLGREKACIHITLGYSMGF
jgi:hypothetical protein